MAAFTEAGHANGLGPRNPPSEYMPKSNAVAWAPKTGTRTCRSALFLTAQTGNSSSITEQINKLWSIHTTEYYAARRVNENDCKHQQSEQTVFRQRSQTQNRTHGRTRTRLCRDSLITKVTLPGEVLKGRGLQEPLGAAFSLSLESRHTSVSTWQIPWAIWPLYLRICYTP